MKLRTRLALTVTAVMLPTAGVLLWLDGTARHDAAAHMLTRIIADDLPGHEEECRAMAPTWGNGLFGGPQKGRWSRRPPPPPPGGPEHSLHDDRGPPPRPHGPPDGGPPGAPHRPIVAYAYTIDGKPARGDAPALDMATATALKPGDLYVLPWHLFSDDVEVLARTASADSCAFVLVSGATGSWGAVLPATWLWLLPVLLVSGGVLFFVGSVVERLRKLAGEVRRTAEAGYGGTITAQGNDEVTELATAFSEASTEIRARVTELERREKALREFIANTTHDVMIPLTVLQGHLAEGETQIAAAREEAHYVAALVHNLGLAARLDAAQPQIAKSRVDLGELLQRVASRHRPVATERDIAIEVGAGLDPLYAMADMTLLEQAVSNLAYNAVRHNREGGHVALIVESLDGPRFRIRVLDDGPGIPAQDIARLMERGARGDVARGRDQGQGIGLDIARRALAVQGFTLTLAPGAESGLEADIEGPASKA